MSGSTWKGKERIVAGWFDGYRNPLSGRNNRDDKGNRRVGDVIYPPALIEVKYRSKVSSITRAKETQRLADKEKLPWLHIEFQRGSNACVAIVLTAELAEEMVRGFLRPKWEGEPGPVAQAESA